LSEAPSTSVSAARPPRPTATTLVWEWPLRLWHWLFAACISGSLYTGLAEDIGLLAWHMRVGYCILGLLLFRLLWAIWGGRHARFSSYATSPGRILAYFKGEPASGAHTPPGSALILVLWLLVTMQVLAGLFASDEIFTEGPLARYGSDQWVEFMTGAHHRIFWLIIAAIVVHLSAHAVYALRRDPTPLSMFTGRKAVSVQPTDQHWTAALLTAAAVVSLVWYALQLV
jgi:cytochrome b